MRRHQVWLVVVLIAAAIGVVFSAVSTYDFVQHLDRQVHNLHCSFILGVSHGGESGCQVAMMSTYSSVLRGQVWGGIPISLPAMSVFAFLMFYALDLMVTRRKHDPRATGFLALAAVLPALTSLVMLVISLRELGTTCKLCVGVYLASAACLVGGLVLWRGAVGQRRGDLPVERGRRDGNDEPEFVGTAKTESGARLVAVGVETGAVSSGFLAAMFGIGVAFVAIPVVVYLALAPDHARFIGTCEGLPNPDDGYGVMVRVDRTTPTARAAPAIEVLDPLCPACRAFEQRLAASGLIDQLDRKAVLFPLDNTCNWMVTEATHPGACTISEAVLCARGKAPEVIAWAFEMQDRIRSETKADPAAAARLVKQRFPELASCVGSPDARSRLNKSMRWIVANNIRVLTPQLFVAGVKLCDEDVDLGLEYTLSNMLERHARGTLARLPLENAPASDGPAPGQAASDDGAAEPSGKPSRSASDPSAASKATGKPATGKAADKAEVGGADPPAARGASAGGAAGKGAAGPAAIDGASDKGTPDPGAPDRPAEGATDRPSEPASDRPSDPGAADSRPSNKAEPDPGTSDKPAPDPDSGKPSDSAADTPVTRPEGTP